MNEQERLMFLGWAQTSKFKRKIQQSKQIIEDALAVGPAYVSCSWGKDSTALLHLCQSVQPDIKVYFLGHSEQDLIANFSEVEQSYITRFTPNYESIFMERALERQYKPDKIKRVLFNAVSEEIAIVGVRAEESINRRRSLSKYGPLHSYQDGKHRAWPIAYWGWRDVWAYICAHELPYLSVYDEIPKDSPESRTALHFGRSANSTLNVERWARLKKTAPEFIQYVKENYDANWL